MRLPTPPNQSHVTDDACIERHHARKASHEERGQRCRNAAQASDDVLSLGSHDSQFDLDNRKDDRIRLTPSFHAALVIPKQRNDDDDMMMKGKWEMKRLRALCAKPSCKVPPSVRPGRLAVVSPPPIPLHFCLPGRDGIPLHSSLDGLECYLRDLAHNFLLEGSSGEWAVVSHPSPGKRVDMGPQSCNLQYHLERSTLRAVRRLIGGNSWGGAAKAHWMLKTVHQPLTGD